MWGASRIRRATPVLVLLGLATMTGGSTASAGVAVGPPGDTSPVSAVRAVSPALTESADTGARFDDALVVETSASQIGPGKPRPAGSSDIPARALASYRHASMALAVATSCRIPWSLVAAIGGVASDHGRRGGSQLTDAGLARPALVAAPADGTEGAAASPDTDGGALDGHAGWDAPVGPLNLLPSSWRRLGVDGDGNGTRDPQDLDDAAMAVAAALCSSGDNLTRVAAMKQAVIDFSDDPRYAAAVLELEREYRTTIALPAPTQGIAVSARQQRDTGPVTPAPRAEETVPTTAARVPPTAAAQPAPSPVAESLEPSGSPEPTPTGAPTPCEPPDGDALAEDAPIEDGTTIPPADGTPPPAQEPGDAPSAEPSSEPTALPEPCPSQDGDPVPAAGPTSGQPTVVLTEPAATPPGPEGESVP